MASQALAITWTYNLARDLPSRLLLYSKIIHGSLTTATVCHKTLLLTKKTPLTANKISSMFTNFIGHIMYLMTRRPY